MISVISFMAMLCTDHSIACLPSLVSLGEIQDPNTDKLSTP